jgi:hypothetical protein
MRQTGSSLIDGATVRSSFSPAGGREQGDDLFSPARGRRPRRDEAMAGEPPAAFGQYAISRAVLAGGCAAVGGAALATSGRLRRRLSL